MTHGAVTQHSDAVDRAMPRRRAAPVGGGSRWLDGAIREEPTGGYPLTLWSTDEAKTAHPLSPSRR
jgi:hypothetical protein